MKQPPFDWRIDSGNSYVLWCAAKREIGIRAGQIPPETARERRWRDEGPVQVQQLEAGR